jgi:hydroxyacylglutathione hydrolase
VTVALKRMEVRWSTVLSQPIVKQMKVGAFQVFTYIVACPETRRAVVIDLAGEEERLLSLIKEEAFIIEYILDTHGHADHVLANEHLKNALAVPTCMHELEIQTDKNSPEGFFLVP